MTIKLLTPRGKYPVNAIVAFDAATEAALVADKVATTNLTGGTAYVAPAAGNTPQVVSNVSYAGGKLFDGNGNEITSLVSGAGISFAFGADGSDVTVAFLAACAVANAADVPLLLPPWTISISQTAAINRITGVLGKSKIILAPDFTKTGYNNQFCFINSAFSSGYNATTANTVFYDGFDVETTPNSSRSVFGLANVKSGGFKNVNIRVNQVIDGGTGKPYVADALIDLYACVKNVFIKDCLLENLTGAYGTNKISQGGGGSIWIRNLRSTSAVDSVTENVTVTGCTIRHQTSDEAIACFGVLGTVRNCRIANNWIYGLDTLTGAYQPTLVSVFPFANVALDAALGPTAATYNNVVEGNYIESRSHLYNVLRFGNTPDAAYPCYGNKSRNNIIICSRSSDGVTGPRAIWVAAGSPGTDPDLGSKAIRCIEGTQGVAYTGVNSGNESVNDTVDCVGGSQTNAAFSGFQKVTNATTKNNCFTGMEQCRNVSGGEIECFGRSYYECNNVNGGTARVNGGGGAYSVMEITTGSAAKFVMSGVEFNSAARFVTIGSSVPAASSIMVLGCQGSIAGAVAAIINGANASTVVKCHNNHVTGASITGPTSGTGTTTRTGNNWAGTTD